MSRIICMDEVESWPVPRKVTVQRLVWDWNDPSETVENEIRCIGGRFQQGCWYLNPMFRVACPKLTRGFIGVFRKRQKQWFRELSRQFRSANWRRLMQVTKNVRQRRTTFTGILVIEGQVIDPRTQWRLEAQFGLHPGSDIIVARRPHTFSCLREQDWGSLKQSLGPS